MVVASHINRYTDIILPRERLYVITSLFLYCKPFHPKGGARWNSFLSGRQQILSMVSADGGDVYPIVLVTEVHVTLVALHVPLEDMDIGACMLTLSWYNSNMNVGTSNHWTTFPWKDAGLWDTQGHSLRKILLGHYTGGDWEMACKNGGQVAVCTVYVAPLILKGHIHK